MLLRGWSRRSWGFEKGGGAVLLTRAPGDRPKAAVPGATNLSRSSTPTWPLLRFALVAPTCVGRCA